MLFLARCQRGELQEEINEATAPAREFVEAVSTWTVKCTYLPSAWDRVLIVHEVIFDYSKEFATGVLLTTALSTCLWPLKKKQSNII